METYLVGGAVRDELLQLEVREHDWVVVGSTSAELIAGGFKPVGKDFPVFLHPETREEYALARTERRTGPGHRGFECDTENVTLEQDLKRRDLTINAIAKSADGQLIDPHDGIRDLHERVLRHISPAFREDPLRVLRVARLAAQLSGFGFEIASETLTLMREMVKKGELETLTPERVRLETEKAMTTAAPEVFFQTLEAVGAALILWPDLTILDANRLQTIANRTDDVIYRWTALLCELDQDTLSEFSARYRLSSRLSEFISAALLLLPVWPRHSTNSNEDIVELMYQVDAFRQPERFEQLNAFASLVHPDLATTSDWWRSVHVALADIGRTDVDPSLQGAAIGDAIRAARVQRLEQFS